PGIPGRVDGIGGERRAGGGGCVVGAVLGDGGRPRTKRMTLTPRGERPRSYFSPPPVPVATPRMKSRPLPVTEGVSRGLSADDRFRERPPEYRGAASRSRYTGKGPRDLGCRSEAPSLNIRTTSTGRCIDSFLVPKSFAYPRRSLN